MTKRIGSKMTEAAAYVARHPGCVMMDVARYVSPCPVPSQNWALGYNPVWRAVRAGLIRVEKGSRKGSYALYPGV